MHRPGGGPPLARGHSREPPPSQCPAESQEQDPIMTPGCRASCVRFQRFCPGGLKAVMRAVQSCRGPAPPSKSLGAGAPPQCVKKAGSPTPEGLEEGTTALVCLHSRAVSQKGLFGSLKASDLLGSCLSFPSCFSLLEWERLSHHGILETRLLSQLERNLSLTHK